MHKENLVLSIVTAEGICRENSGQVYLPYGTEYYVRLKNLDVSRRVVARVTIDGESVTESGIIVDANSTLDLQGFLKGNSVKNSFKFIELTDRIRNHKGDRPDWGIITVSFQFEDNPWQDYKDQQKRYKEMMDVIEKTKKAREVIKELKYPWDHVTRNPYPPKPWILFGQPCRNLPGLVKVTGLSCSVNQSESIVGLTVPGTPVHQDFQATTVGHLGPTHTISLQIVGQRPDAQPVKTVRTARRASCPTCGTKQRGNAKYCNECSTCLL